MPTIGLHDAVTVNATDTDGVESVTIYVAMGSNPIEMVYASTTGGEAAGAATFDPRFTDTVRNVVTDGFEYVFQRDGGWRSATMDVTAVVVDAAGEMTVSTTSFTVTDPATLAVLDVLPADFGTDAAAAKHMPVTFTVRGAVHVLVALRYANSSERVIAYDDGFQGAWAAASSAVVDDVDLDFSIIPNGGWQASIACLSIIATDDLGNAINFGDEP